MPTPPPPGPTTAYVVAGIAAAALSIALGWALS